MSKYIYINSHSQSSTSNANVGLVFVENITDFECEFTDTPLQFKTYGTIFGLTWNIVVDNNLLTNSQAKELTDKAFSKAYIESLNGVNSTVEFFPPNGVTFASQV
jgi:hypothetical protein